MIKKFLYSAASEDLVCEVLEYLQCGRLKKPRFCLLEMLTSQIICEVSSIALSKRFICTRGLPNNLKMPF